jgi:hypothetical protein
MEGEKEISFELVHKDWLERCMVCMKNMPTVEYRRIDDKGRFVWNAHPKCDEPWESIAQRMLEKMDGLPETGEKRKERKRVSRSPQTDPADVSAPKGKKVIGLLSAQPPSSLSDSTLSDSSLSDSSLSDEEEPRKRVRMDTPSQSPGLM